ncbi:efflux RND transporter periplasmic adaptor subunit [Zunongwangia sp. F363]|uniref:Efflux RND transporter periplasmic adaptor subunit n=1 Tax=Autumnicola tepida TaxID=3075595 RepID=A0ABU3CBQ7_9FLAO|nr:efflux RND transporter periplasmic adaptor subunit [Zunongwangia sp. F363]MDT0643776.1 efflux RND transporter periplasmic adaptor subunit [Zunongwangia sp. F363]
MSTKKIVIICAAILLAGAAVTFIIFSTEPTAKSEGATRQSAMLVDVVKVEKGDYRPMIVATGTVSPVEDVMLSPLVGGQIVRRDESFTPGGFVKKGEILLQIDPSDYRNTLEMRKSDLLQTQTNLDMEMGRQQVARQDLQLIGGDTLSREERSLVLRQPQLNAVKGNIKAAEAAVEQARLNLARTTIKAPFNAHVLSQNVTLGSQVAPGDNLGRLVGTNSYWVNLTVPVGKLQWLNFPGSEEDKGSMVKIINSTAWPAEAFRTGYLDKQVGALDAETRLARILVKVPDPLAQADSLQDKPELMIGSFVEAQMIGEEIEDVARINRDLVRSNQTVWVMKKGKLVIRKVEILLSDADYAYISKGLEEGELVVTTNLSTVAEGLDLRRAADSTAAGNEEMEGTEE